MPLIPKSSVETFINQEARTPAPFVVKVARLESIELLYIEKAAKPGLKWKCGQGFIHFSRHSLRTLPTRKMFYLPASLRSRWLAYQL